MWVPDVLLYNKYVLTTTKINKSYATWFFRGVKNIEDFRWRIAKIKRITKNVSLHFTFPVDGANSTEMVRLSKVRI